MPFDCFCLGTTASVCTGSAGILGSHLISPSVVPEGHRRRRNERGKSDGSLRALKLLTSVREDVLTRKHDLEEQLADLGAKMSGGAIAATLLHCPQSSNATPEVEPPSACKQTVAPAAKSPRERRGRIALPERRIVRFDFQDEWNVRWKELEERANASERRVVELEASLAERGPPIPKLTSNRDARAREWEEILQASADRTSRLELALAEQERVVDCVEAKMTSRDRKFEERLESSEHQIHELESSLTYQELELGRVQANDMRMIELQTSLHEQRLSMVRQVNETDARARMLEEAAQGSEHRIADLQSLLAEQKRAMTQAANESETRVRELEDLVQAQNQRIADLDSSRSKHELAMARSEGRFQELETMACLVTERNTRVNEFEEREQALKRRVAELESSFLAGQASLMLHVDSQREARDKEMDEPVQAEKHRTEALEAALVQGELLTAHMETERNTHGMDLEERTEATARRILELEAAHAQREFTTAQLVFESNVRIKELVECTQASDLRIRELEASLAGQESLMTRMLDEKDSRICELEQMLQASEDHMTEMACTISGKVGQANEPEGLAQVRQSRMAELESRLAEQKIKLILLEGECNSRWGSVAERWEEREYGDFELGSGFAQQEPALTFSGSEANARCSELRERAQSEERKAVLLELELAGHQSSLACLESEMHARTKSIDELTEENKTRISELQTELAENNLPIVKFKVECDIRDGKLKECAPARKDQIGMLESLRVQQGCAAAHVEGERDVQVQELEDCAKADTDQTSALNLSLPRAVDLYEYSQALFTDNMSLKNRIHELECQNHIKDTLILKLESKLQALMTATSNLEGFIYELEIPSYDGPKTERTGFNELPPSGGEWLSNDQNWNANHQKISEKDNFPQCSISLQEAAPNWEYNLKISVSDESEVQVQVSTCDTSNIDGRSLDFDSPSVCSPKSEMLDVTVSPQLENEGPEQSQSPRSVCQTAHSIPSLNGSDCEIEVTKENLASTEPCAQEEGCVIRYNTSLNDALGKDWEAEFPAETIDFCKLDNDYKGFDSQRSNGPTSDKIAGTVSERLERDQSNKLPAPGLAISRIQQTPAKNFGKPDDFSIRHVLAAASNVMNKARKQAGQQCHLGSPAQAYYTPQKSRCPPGRHPLPPKKAH